MRWLIAHFYLYPLLVENFRQRRAGTLPDELHWSDALLMEWGYWDLCVKADRAVNGAGPPATDETYRGGNQ